MLPILFAFFAFLAVCASAQTEEQFQASSDTLSSELNELLYASVENLFIDHVDSLMKEGMYMQALETIDSLHVNWEKMTGRVPSPLLYMMEGQIYMRLEEWQHLVNTTTECIYNNKDTMPDNIAALIFSMQGSGFLNLEDYNNAIRSLEHALGHYSKVGDLGGQGDMLCTIANCYDKLEKHSIALSSYEKGLSKYLQYFNTTRKQLLQSNLRVNDIYKEATLGVFAVHLFNMAVHEQDFGDRTTSKEYLLMSAHCGYRTAISEYERIYGRN